MEKENKEQEEPEVITFKEIAERHKDMKYEEMCKLVLVCKNCGHQDLLKNFIKEKNRWVGKRDPKIDPDEWEPKPYKPPKPYHPKFPRPNSWSDKVTCMMINNISYEDMFFCPVCKSSLVCLNPKFSKNNIARTL